MLALRPIWPKLYEVSKFVSREGRERKDTCMHQASIVHTGILSFTYSPSLLAKNNLDVSPKDVLMGAPDSSVFLAIEKSELEHPSARKVLPDRTTYCSQTMPITNEPPVIWTLVLLG